MENHLSVAGQGFYFFLFYNLAFISAFCILLYEGHRRNFPMMRWALLLAFSWISFVAGSKLITLSIEDWELFLKDFLLPEVTSKNLLGGLITGFIALSAGKILFRFKQNFADVFAYVIPLSVAIQRVGCFLNGCCHGTPANVPWAVSYSGGTLAHFHQFESGLINGQELFALPVHPVQLYETLGCILVILILWRLAKILKAGGSLMLASFILFSIQHFIVEFFRDPMAHTGFLRTHGVLSQLQWLIIFLVVTLLFLLFRKEMKFRVKINQQPQSDVSIKMSAVTIFLYFTLFLAISNWLTYSEVISVILLLTFVLIFQVSRMISAFRYLPVYRYAFIFILLPLLLMSQDNPETKKDSSIIRKFNTIRIGSAAGNFYNSQSFGQGEGCDRIGQTSYFQQKYTLGGVGYSVTKENQETGEISNFGLNAMIGSHNEIRLSNNYRDRQIIWGLTPFFSYSQKWFGLGIGLHLGNLTIITENLDKEGNSVAPETSILKTQVYPQGYLRLGPRKWISADFHIADQFPSALPGFRYQLGIGSGFGQENQAVGRMGVIGPSSPKDDWLFENWIEFNGAYLAGYFPVKDKYVLEPMIIYNFDPGSESAKAGFQFSIGLGYRFGHTSKNKVQ